jgi:hypothetical protein
MRPDATWGHREYNDPLCVKVEKLDIMVRLENENNVDAIYFLS